jgi:hypothetical protein
MEVMSMPSIKILPLVGSVKRRSERASVDCEKGRDEAAAWSVRRRCSRGDSKADLSAGSPSDETNLRIARAIVNMAGSRHKERERKHESVPFRPLQLRKRSLEGLKAVRGHTDDENRQKKIRQLVLVGSYGVRDLARSPSFLDR